MKAKFLRKSGKKPRWCKYCKVLLTRKTGVTRDHVIPKSVGGINAQWNKVWCCYDCNQKKKNTMNTNFSMYSSKRGRY